MKKSFLFILILLSITLVACSKLNVQVEGDATIITLNLSEGEVATIVSSALVNVNDVQIQNPVIDLRPGSIYVTALVTPKGGQSTQGDLTINVWAQDGGIQAEVTQMNIGGLNSDEQTLTDINQKLKAAFAQSANQGQNAQVTNVSITETQLSFTIRIPR
ncbi:hypothetical protein MASR2M15_14780 [Anaerolineales bacterium]